MSFEHLEGAELVYFVRAACTPPLIKIGSTSSLSVRFTSMRAASPVELTVVGVVVCHGPGRVRELRLQRRFAHCHAHHKWFHAAPELLQFITAHAALPTDVDDAVETLPTGTITELLDATENALEPLVPIGDVATKLGVSIPTVRRYVRDRDVPYVRVGRQLRFDIREFAGFGADSET